MHHTTGRNAPCPCNSGKKFKKCHGSLDLHEAERVAAGTRHEAREFQRREQQGLGRAIISTQVNGHRIVAVGRQLHTSKNWRTFHDFLRDYPRIVLGDDWWQEEIRKPKDDQHRIVVWFLRACEQAAVREINYEESRLPATGALSAYIRFAYDLYALQHAVGVEPLLIDRIRSPRGFTGAMYEVRVAASLLRAGFTLELEDETDRRSTHVEFVATHVATGAKFSVEAKRREGTRLKVNKLLHSALTKHAEHPRIVFIDTNDGRLELHQFEKLPIALAETKRLLKCYTEDRVGRALPPAYVIATLTLEEHHLDATNLPFSFLLWGFRVNDMQPAFKSLIEQVQTRHRHLPVFELIESMEKHRTIPVSFIGEADVFASNQPSDRLQIGFRYTVPGPGGVDVEAVLEGGVVMPEQKQAFCTFLGVNGERFMCMITMTNAELEAYKQHPSTFFGVVDRNAGRKPLRTAMDYFNFFWESARDTPKAKLLEHMKAASDISEMAALSQADLAMQYCVRMAEWMIRDATTPQS
ncbi:SEC-C domain-containing protein [Pseudomonas sp. P115]|uniref:YecA family protein n=1 Tax=Pseudomonas pisciculturae TaxID=2730413 RepID=UPI001892792E|nr:SEC-C domain-containing protein [Pseudomonas pisciculturae]MBF6031479.1 SEC-C domain-containing protein [Pseudomonas pisciculturae]